MSLPWWTLPWGTSTLVESLSRLLGNIGVQQRKLPTSYLLPRFAADPLEKAAYGSSPLFGVNLGVTTEGRINLGDRVYVARA